MPDTGTTEDVPSSTLMTTNDSSSDNQPFSSVDNFFDPLPCYSLYCIFEQRYRQENYNILMCIAIMLGILGSMGLMGNSLVLTVLLRAKIKPTSVYFMLMLSILDLMACVVVIPGIVITEWHFPFTNDFLCKLWEAIRYFTIPTSAMVLVAIALERCVIICFAPKRVSKKMCFLIISMILLFGACLGVLPALGMGVYSSNGFYMGYCIPNYQHISLDSLTKYWRGITSIFIIMIISIIIFYSSIFFTVFMQNRKWNKIRSQQPSTCKNKEINKEPRRCSAAPDVMFATRASEKLLEIPQNILCETTTPIENFEYPSESNQNTLIVNIEEDFKNPSESTSKNQTADKPPITGDDRKTEIQSNSKLPIPHNSKNTTPIQAKRKCPPIKSSRKIHIKTTQVLFTVTMVYIVSFLPTFLIANDLLPEFRGRRVIYLIYFLNNTANPIIYSFMNPQFRKEVWKFLKCKSR